MPQVDELQSILGSISTDVDDVASNVTSLHEQLEQLQQTTPPQVDLTAVIAQARNIRDRLDSVAAAIGSPAAAPVGQEADEDIGGAQGSGDGEVAGAAGEGASSSGSDLGGQSGAGDSDTGSAGEGQPGPDQNGTDTTTGSGEDGA